MVLGRDDGDSEEVLVRITRGELRDLISVLRKAEELCDDLRQREQDFRMHRLRLLRIQSESIPPPLAITQPPPPLVADFEDPISQPPTPRRPTARYIELRDVQDLVSEKETKG